MGYRMSPRGGAVSAPMLGVLAVMLGVGCGAESDDDVSEVDEVEAVEPDEVVADEPEEEAPGYSIHEWGLIDVDLGEARAEYAAGPGQAEAAAATASGGGGGGTTAGGRTNGRPNTVDNAVNAAGSVFENLTGRPSPIRPGPGRRKPVLYFHLAEANPELRVNITVDLGSAARMIEHFPAGTLNGQQVSWSDISLQPGSCTGGPYPTEESELCANVVDDYCEAAELSAYVADDASCLTVGGSQQNFLFYRGDGPAPDLPLTIVRNDDGSVTITNTTLGTPVGELFRLRRSGDTVQVAQIAIPSSGNAISVGLPATAAADSHRAALRAQLLEIGLTAGEAGAFERAWFDELFNGEGSTPHAFVDAILFFLPQSQVDGFAHIGATPAPAQTVRAMAVRAGWTSL